MLLSLIFYNKPVC